MPAPPLNTRVAKPDQETERPATWKRDAPAAIEVRKARAGGFLFSRGSRRGSKVKRISAEFDPMGTRSLRGAPCGLLLTPSRRSGITGFSARCSARYQGA